MSSSATKVDSCSSGSTIGSVFEDWLQEAMNEDCTHGNVTHGSGYVQVWGGISHMGKTSLRVLDQMSLEPFIAEFWKNTWLYMAGHGIATIGYWLMKMPDPIGPV